MQLVPTVEAKGHLQLPNGSVISFDDTRFFRILFGGDQVSVARIRGTQALRDTQDKCIDRFEGLIPVVEDWHSRMTLMKVSQVWITLLVILCRCLMSSLNFLYTGDLGPTLQPKINKREGNNVPPAQSDQQDKCAI